MKKLLPLFFFLCIYFVNAQESRGVKTFGINGGISYNENWNDGTINHYSLTYSFGKHSVFAGILLTDFYVIRPEPETKKTPGFQAGYRFYPLNKCKVIRPFVEYDLNYISKSEYKEGYNIDNFSCSYSQATAKRLYMDHLICVGFDINFLKHFYISGSAGSGFEWTQFKITEKCDNGPESVSGDGIGLSNYAPIFVKASLGFNFLSIRNHK